MADDTTRDVFKVLIACRGLELATAGLYDELAVLHSHVPAMAQLWKKTAREELNHAAQFTLALEAMSEVISGTVGNPSALDNLRRAIENTVEEFRLHRPSLREALKATIDLETSMSSLHADQIVVFTDRRCRRLFEAMMAADAGHIACLRVALYQLGAVDI